MLPSMNINYVYLLGLSLIPCERMQDDIAKEKLNGYLFIKTRKEYAVHTLTHSLLLHFHIREILSVTLDFLLH